ATAVNISPTINANDNNANNVRNVGSVELSYDNAGIVVGPRRDDEGPDDISYWSLPPSGLFDIENLWSRTRFTPNATFVLWGVDVMPLNQGPNFDDECYVRVYQEDQDNHDLEDMLWEGEIERLDEFNFNDYPANWHWIELDEDDRLEFEANESFSIIYGPAPGGDYDPQNMNEGDGWWTLFDGAAPNPPRSFRATDDVPSRHRDWTALTGDLFIRANGEYTEDFIDVGVTSMFNEAEQWLMIPGTEQEIVAKIENFGNDAQDLIVTFMAYTLDGEPYWNESVGMIIDNIDAEEEIEVTCDSTFSSEEAGHFVIEVDVDAMGDSNADNDFYYFEQIVFDPAGEENEFWIGYCGDVPTSGTNGNAGSGWITTFGHPGGQNDLTVKQFRQFLRNYNDNAVDCRFAIAVYDGQDHNWVWEGEAECSPADGGEWVTVELDEEEIEATAFGEGEEVWICLYHINGVPVQMDGSAPVAGTNNDDMPAAMRSTPNNGEMIEIVNGGDFMCQALFGTTEPTGALLSIEPDPVEFGDDLELAREYIIEATFTAFGDQDVEISGMRVSGSGADYLSVEPTEFTLEALSSQTVNIRFYSDSVHVDLDSRILVANTSENMANYVWNVTAKTNSVDDYQDRIPEEFELAQNHPNPFNPTTSIDFTLKTVGMVNLSVYDMNGRLVSEVVNGNMNTGYHTVEFDAVDLPAGIYIYRINAGDFTSVRKMVLMK
ncbi:MAG: T9SS type A sorting domain-containing protein, partial [Calditrichaeota bacterium]|nr:T9SS type A sorting domain-containing protein [Calditrichota bacterium]